LIKIYHLQLDPSIPDKDEKSASDYALLLGKGGENLDIKRLLDHTFSNKLKKEDIVDKS
jgi:hypothetical protein